MNNNLTYREKFTCEMIWGGIPTDIDWIKASPMFNDGLKRFDKGEWVQFEKEIWKDVVGYEGFYQVSNLGKIRSLDRILIVKNQYSEHERIQKGQMLKLSADSLGYIKIDLCDNLSKSKSVKLHCLIMQAFIGERPNKFHINHINGIKTDNRLINLEYVTPSQNIKHAYDTGLNIHKNAHEWHRSKLSEADVEYILKNYERKKKGVSRGNVGYLAEMFSVSRGTIRNLIIGLTYKPCGKKNS